MFTRRLCVTPIALATCFAMASCARNPGPPAPVAAGDDVALVLLIENTTPHQVGVYLIDQKMHVRLGTVKARSESRLPVRKAQLRNRSQFRIYAFRGAEACPVARLIDVTASRTPRVTVAVSDSVVSGYLPNDGCLPPKRGQTANSLSRGNDRPISTNSYRIDPERLSSIAIRGDVRTPPVNIVGAIRLHDGTVVVADGEGARVIFYGPDQHVIRSIVLESPRRSPPQITGLKRVAGDTVVVLGFREGWVLEPGSKPPVRIAIGDESGRPRHFSMMLGMLHDGSSLWGVIDLKKQATPRSGRWIDSISIVRLLNGGDTASVTTIPMLQLTNDLQGRPRPPWLSPTLVYDVRGQVLYHGFGADYAITKLNVLSGSAELWRRKWTPRKVTAADIDSFIDGWSINWNRDADSLDVKAEMRKDPYSELVPAFSQFLVGSSGDLWVRSPDLIDAQGNGELYTVPYVASEWSIFNDAGVWLTNVTLPGGFLPTDIGADYILGVRFGMLQGRPRGGARHIVLYKYRKIPDRT